MISIDGIMHKHIDVGVSNFMCCIEIYGAKDLEASVGYYLKTSNDMVLGIDE